MMRYYIAAIVIVILFLFTYAGYINYIGNKEAMVFSRQIQISNNINNSVVKIMTYNIKHGVGIDGKLNLERVARTIDSAGVQVIGLNEVDNQRIRSNFKKQYQILARKLKMNYTFGPTLRGITGSYGNAILTTFPIEKVENYSLPITIGHEPRGVLEAQVILPDQTKLRVLTTHLSASKKERKKQIKWLNNYLENIGKEPFVLMGDFNDEINFSQNYELLSKTVRTYPAENPSEKIDIIFSNHFLDEGVTINSKASDHLPLIAEMKYK